ncbi:MAG: hypothetical protein MUF78_06905 [Candidatus Edwardsbacteria bacterium]|jgi:hypothetical protein|nr:hypothetical protein [Candidatus Edwardsbacteria bacterium]
MMKELLLAMSLGIACNAVGADTLTVTIKGLDDGKQTSRQQDYREAVLDAKRQAIEQAGVTVTSRTTVVNATLQEDFIESQAEAVLLPGFQVIDIGYIADGTYQVVLSGRVQAVAAGADERPGVLALAMDLYSVPITFQLDGRPLDAAKPFLAICATQDSQAIATFTSLRELKRCYGNLLHHFVYLFKLPPGKHRLDIKASIMYGNERSEKINMVEAEVLPGQYTVYEYLSDPDYSFAAADREFLLGRFARDNRFRDTTAAFRGRVERSLVDRISAFGGITF